MPVDAFLRALMRDVAWGFFYGTVNFDQVFGTTNYYGEVDMFVGATNEAYTSAGREFIERFKSNDLMDIFKQMVSDWTNEGYDPFAAPMETGVPWGVKNGDNDGAVGRQRVTARRMVGLKGDTPIRTDANGYPVNRMFEDVKQDAPEVYAGAGLRARGLGVQPVRLSVAFRRDLEPVGLLGGQGQPVLPDLGRVHPAGRARQRPLRVVHHAVGRDRLEHQGRRTGRPKAVVKQRAGDVACMPADIRHQGFSAKRAMLLVWENGSPKVPDLIREGKAPNVAVQF